MSELNPTPIETGQELSRPRPRRNKGFFLHRVWRWVGTMRFSLVLLLLLALASVAAIACQEFLPTGGLENPEAFYKEKLSPLKFILVQSFDILHPYTSWWYMGLLVLLSLSLASCVVSRLRSVLRTSFQNEPLESLQELKGLAIGGRVKAAAVTVPEEFAERVRRLGFRVNLNRTGSGFQVAGTRRGLGRLGGILNHLGLLSIFVGGIVVSLLAERKMVWMIEGNEVTSPNGNYTVVLDSFLVEANAEGAISDYLSYVRVKQGDELVSANTIQVNHPLRHEGWSWYQTTYRLVTERLRRMTVDVSDSTGTHMGLVALNGSAPAPLPGRPDIRVSMGRFFPHFQIQEGKPVNLSNELVNPAVQLQVHRADQPIHTIWLFFNHPDFSHDQEQFKFTLVGIEPLFATGLEVRSFPGAAGVWVGFALMTLGLGLSFGMNHERIWVLGTRNAEGGWVLDVGARSMHGEASLKGRFDSMLRTLGRVPETEEIS